MGEKMNNRRQYSLRSHLRRIAEDWIVYAPIVAAVWFGLSPFALKTDFQAIQADVVEVQQRMADNSKTWKNYLDDEGDMWKASDNRLDKIYIEGLKTQRLILQSEERALRASGVSVPLSITNGIKDINTIIETAGR